jgi:hypothetical protein
MRKRRAAVLVPVPAEPCTDDLNAAGIIYMCGCMNEARIGEGRKSLLTTTITKATSAPETVPTMSHNGFEFAADGLTVVGVGVGEAEVEAELLTVGSTGVAVGALALGPSTEGAVVGVPLGNSLEGEVVADVCVGTLVSPGRVGTVVTGAC